MTIGDLAKLLGIGAGAAFAWLYQHAATGVATQDRYGIRGSIVLQAIRHFGTGPDARLLPVIVRLYQAKTHNESQGRPGNYLGDTGLQKGPSIGPGQVLRTTAQELGIWQPSAAALATPTLDDDRAEYAAKAQSAGIELWGIGAGLAVFKDKLRIVDATHADGPRWGRLWSALRRYNGSGPGAEQYRENAQAFYRRTWPDDPAGEGNV